MKNAIMLTKTQIKLLSKDKMSIFWFLAFPLLFVLLFGYVVPNVGNQYDLVIMDENNSVDDVVNQLLTFPNSKLEEEALFEENITELKHGTFSILVIISNKNIDIHYLAEEKDWVKNIENVILPIVGEKDIKTHSYENIHKIEPIDFILPGMIGLTIMQIGFFGGTSLLEDRSKQILRRFKINGIRPWEIVLSHIMSRLLLIFSSSFVLIIFGKFILKVPLQFDQWYLQLVFILLGGLTFLSLGLFIASILRSPEAGNIISQSFNFLMAFICGIFIPLSVLPDIVQSIVSILPLTPLVEVLRNLFLGISIDSGELLIAGAIIILWGGLSFIVSSLLFKWE